MVHSPVLLCSILLYKYTTIYLSILLLRNIWVAFNVHINALIYLGYNVGVELLGYEVGYMFSFFFQINLFIYFWLRWVFVAAHGLSLVAVSGDYSSLRCVGFSLRWLLLLWSTGSRYAGSVVVACGL